MAALTIALGATACSGAGSTDTGDRAHASSSAKAKAAAKKKAKKKAKAGQHTSSGKKASSAKKGEKSPTRSSTKNKQKKPVPKLTSRTFVATSLGDQKVIKGSTITVSFGDGKITVEPGCATLEGTATWDADGLSVTGEGLASTPKACAHNLEQQDVWVQALLEAKPTFTLKGDTMEITDGFSSMTLTERT